MPHVRTVASGMEWWRGRATEELKRRRRGANPRAAPEKRGGRGRVMVLGSWGFRSRRYGA